MQIKKKVVQQQINEHDGFISQDVGIAMKKEREIQ